MGLAEPVRTSWQAVQADCGRAEDGGVRRRKAIGSLGRVETEKAVLMVACQIGTISLESSLARFSVKTPHLVRTSENDGIRTAVRCACRVSES